ncbi:hypothetical protein NADFUDRAFT_44561 [Nadsonia fulvescens var. elongata DSM 6958]|uniref:S15/NS1 RNA-binding domain-containing protein n=1 Tax=Nadsonia fulvescens var. elongata DSM 6958 TaxID=857566 RepID=A0A1E3PSB3_9ASCO|nr:hypothetical protein NADFUDRAFT_44561 [Nadsonia fulvescens var. elongata DSM 6958]
MFKNSLLKPFTQLVVPIVSRPTPLVSTASSNIRLFHNSTINSNQIVKQQPIKLLSRSEKRLRSILRVRGHLAKKIANTKDVEFVDPVLGKPNTSFIQRLDAYIKTPTNMSFGHEFEETQKLIYGAEQAALKRAKERNEDWMYQTIIEEGKRQKEAVKRIFDLKNANNDASKKLAVKFAKTEFERFEGDSGSSEVQAAISTVKIHFLAKHLKENKQDLSNTRKLSELVHSRRKILGYLKEKDPKRYFFTIEKLGLDDSCVTGEFTLSRNYFANVGFFGSATLPARIPRRERNKRKAIAQEEKMARRYGATHLGLDI